MGIVHGVGNLEPKTQNYFRVNGALCPPALEQFWVLWVLYGLSKK